MTTNFRVALVGCCCLLLSLGTSACDYGSAGGSGQGLTTSGSTSDGTSTVGAQPPLAATPEANSLELFSSGLLGVAAYLRLRGRNKLR